MKFTEKVKERISRFILNAVIKNNESYPQLKGELFIKAYDTSEDGKLVYRYHHSNVIVNTASILISRLLKNNSEPAAGIAYLALGEGSSDWDIQDPPAPNTSKSLLEQEICRKSIDASTFIDPESGEPTTAHTNIVDYCVTLGEAEGVGPIVEMGLFGGDATEAMNSGTMINWRTFPVINKTNTMIVTIVFRIKA